LPKKEFAPISTSSPDQPTVRTSVGSPARRNKITGRAGIGWELQLLVFFIAAVAVVSRRPDALFNPQFFGEDGAVWYPEAYMFGWFTSVLHPRAGYFQSLPRLAAAVALLAPLRFAPLVMNLIGLTVQVLPVNILLSARCRNWASLAVRACMAIAYLALPNSKEIDVATADAQWHLALLACLLVLACTPQGLISRFFDILVLLLSGLTGPFCLFLLPVSAIFWWVRRDRWRIAGIVTLAVTSAIQLSALLRSASATRPHVILGATRELFLQLVAKQVYLAALLGEPSLGVRRSFLVLSVVALLGTSILVYCLIKASLELKLFIVFSALVFVASLRNPIVSTTIPQWQVLILAAGIRYWFFPMLAFVWALIYCVSSNSNWPIRIIAAAGLLTMPIGIANDWRYPAYKDFDFAAHARQFASAAPGTLVTIPIFPQGWTMQVVKKSSLCRNPPIGSIDEPGQGAHVSGSLPVSGWAASLEPIRTVSIYIDRALVQSAKPDVPRPDVDSFYPQFPGKDKGWRFSIDVSRITAGKHEIEARALEAGGCAADFATVQIERAK
jgi:hypothetical protein